MERAYRFRDAAARPPGARGRRCVRFYGAVIGWSSPRWLYCTLHVIVRFGLVAGPFRGQLGAGTPTGQDGCWKLKLIRCTRPLWPTTSVSLDVAG
jgi:hypothetical protein